MNLKTLAKLSLSMFLMFIMLSGVSFAQIYVDVTNGNDVTGLGTSVSPYASIAKGLSKLATSGGTVVIRAGEYDGATLSTGVSLNIAKSAVMGAYTLPAFTDGAGVTLRLEQLNGNNEVKILNGATFTFNIKGGTLNVVSANGTEYLKLAANTDFNLGNATQNVTVNLASSNVLLPAGATLHLYGTSSFSGSAPTKTNNINVEYLGAGSMTAGPESNYSDFGTGSITINKDNATDVITFPNIIAKVNGVVVTKGGATFQGAVTSTANITVASSGNVSFGALTLGANDLIHNGTGAVTVSGALNFAVTDGAANGNLGSIVNNSTGSVTVSGTTTWTGADNTAAQTFAAAAGTYVIDNESTGSVTLGPVNLVVSNKTDNAGANDYTFTAYNKVGGTLTLGALTADKSGDQNFVATLSVVNAGASPSVVTLAGGNFRGSLVNNSTGTLTLNGTTTVGGALTNAGTAAGTINVNGPLTVAGAITNGENKTIALTADMTLTGAVTHTLNSLSTITGAGSKVIVKGAAAVFNNASNLGVNKNATINNLTIDAAAGTSVAFTATNANDGFVVAGDLVVNNDFVLGDAGGAANEPATFKVNGNTVVNAGTFTVDGENDGAVATVVVNNLTQNGGTITLNPTAVGVTADAGVLKVGGNFSRTSGTFTATDPQALLEANGAIAQTINGGSNFQVANLTVSNTGGIVTLGNSIRASATVTVATGATVELGNLNIVLNATGSKIVNNGTIQTTGGSTGAVIFGGSNFVAGGGSAMDATINAASSAVFSNLIVDVGNANRVITAGTTGNIRFSGMLYLYSGDLNVDDGTATAFELAPIGSNASVKRNITAGTGSTNGITLNGVGTLDKFDNAAVDYDLTYEGTLAADKTINTTSSVEYVQANVRNLTINASGASKAIILAGDVNRTVKGNLVVTGNSTAANAARLTLDNGTLTVNGNMSIGQNSIVAIANNAGSDVTVGGNLTVAASAKLTTGNAGSVIKLTGNSATHSVSGVIDALSVLTIAGTSVQVNGITTAGAGISTLQNLKVDANASATVANIQSIGAGGLITAGGSTLTLGLVQNSSSDADNGTIGGAVTLGGTSFTLTSDVSVGGTITHNLGAFDFGGKTVTLTSGNYTRAADATALYPSATGVLVMKSAGATFDFNNGTISNLTIDANTTLGTGVADHDVTVSGLFNHNSGGLTIAALTNLNVTGNYKYVNGTYTSGAATSLVQLKGATTTLTAYKDVTMQNVVVNSAGTVTFATDGADIGGGQTWRVLTITGSLTQTAGDIALGANDIKFTDNGAANAAYTRVAGVVKADAAGTDFNKIGELIFAGTIAGAGNEHVFTTGENLTVPNVTVNTFTKLAGSKTVTVSNNFKLGANFTMGASGTNTIGYLAIGDNAIIYRSAGTFDKIPAFGNNLSVNYTGAVTTAKELPATVKDLTIGAAVTLNAPVTVNGVLSLAAALTNAADKNVTMAAGSTVSMDGGSLAVAVVPSGAYNLVYNAASTVDVKEWPLVSTIAKITFNKAVNLDQTRTVAGSVGFDATTGSVDLKTFDLNLQGDLLETKTSGFFTNGNLNFTGANAQTLSLNADRAVAANLNITLNKTNATDKVTLTGGNLDFATTPVNINLTKGLLVTGNNVVILKQDKTGGNQPTQGFARTNGAIVGNVKKFIDKTDLIKISRVEYPTGTANGEYRPMAMYFKTAPANSINLTVNHVNAKAGGNNGFPITAGTKQITNYPDFFWYVKSDIALAPSYQYDMDAQAEGYTDYTKDQIQNVRFVRRDSGSVSNQWVMQGADNSYDNSTVSLTKPVVKVIDAQGGITSQGSIFSYSQSNKAPVFTAALTNVAKNEGDTLSGTFTSVDPDFNQTVTLSAVTLPTGATFNATTGKVSWIIGYDVATKTTPSVAKTITIRSTDNMGAYRDTTVTVTVNNKNRLPVVVAMGAKNVAENVAFEYQYAATDADGEAVTYTMNVTGDATLDSAKISTTGKLTWTPGFGNAGKVALLNVNVTDGIGTTTVVDTINVTKTNRAPQFTVKVDTATIPMGSLYNATFTATDLDANTITYSVTGDDTTATINASTGVFSWTPAYKVAGGVYNFTVKATDNGSPALSVTTPLKLTVTLVNAAPVFTATLPNDTVAVGDTLKFKYVATDANGDALTYALVNAPLGATINAATGDFTWIPQASQTAIYVIKATVTDGKISTPVVTSKEVLVKVVTVAVSGKVTYDGSTKGVPGVEVTLTPTTGTAVKATTDASGNYTINNVSSGTYTIKASKTTGWGGVTAGDALLAALFGLDATANPLSAAQKLAADVNGNSSVNAVDAGLIVSKYVDNNTAFAVANWLFVTDASVTVGSKAVTSNITAIAAGDVNRSLANGTIAKNAPSVSASEEQKIAPKAAFTLPIKVAEDAKLGSASIQFTYPVDLVKFEGVIGATGMVSNDVNGTVTIAWFDTKGMTLKAGEVLAGLKFTATEKFAKGQSFTVTVDNSSEITDVKGQPISLALSVANVTVAVPQTFALNQNYPNPFNPTTTISYDLPVDGKVTLSIYNSIGELVTTLVNSVQTAGSYKYNWNAASMSSGVYLYRITVEGQKAYSSTQKMVLMK